MTPLFRRRKKVLLLDNPREESLHIKDLLTKVREELVESQSQRESEGRDALFQVEKLTLEIHFVAQASTELNGGLDLKVVTVGGVHLGGKHTYQDQQIHVITLTLGVHGDNGISACGVLPEGALPYERGPDGGRRLGAEPIM